MAEGGGFEPPRDVTPKRIPVARPGCPPVPPSRRKDRLTRANADHSCSGVADRDDAFSGFCDQSVTNRWRA
jgi:hypothetical protein